MPKSTSLRSAIAAVVVATIATTFASAQQGDLNAILRSSNELYAAGKYDAALVEAQKLERAIKAQFGVNHANYSTALGTLAKVYRAQGRYADATSLYLRALAIGEKALGAHHPHVATTLNNLAVVYDAQGRYADAAGLYQRALVIREKALGASHPDVAGMLNNLANVYQAQGRYADAAGLLRRALAIGEKALGASHPDIAVSLNGLGNMNQAQGQYADAAGLFQRALGIEEKALGADHPRVAGTLSNLAIVYHAQGQYAGAAGLLQRALAIREKALGTDHPDVATTLNNLGFAYQSQNRYADASGLHQRALAIREKTLDANHPDVATSLHNLAIVYQAQGRYADAALFLQRALAIREKALGASHPDVAAALNDLAVTFEDQGKHAEAAGLYQRALAIKQKAFGVDHPDVALTLNNLAVVYQAQGKYAEAGGLHQRALAIREKALGAHHPDVALTFINLALLDGRRGDVRAALNWSRKASRAIIAHAADGVSGAAEQGQMRGLVEQRAGYFRTHVFYLAAATRQKIEPSASVDREALEMSQWAVQSSAASAVQQMAARFTSGGDALGILVRERQDLSAAWREKDKALIAALSKPESEQSRGAIEALRKQIAEIDGKLSVNAARLAKEFPDFAALARPKPLAAEELQKLLGGDEVLVSFLGGEKESYVFAVSRERFEWRPLAIGEKALTDKVASFRRGLDVDELTRPTEAGKPVLFDLGLAQELYATLLGPVEGLIKDKHHLLVVPSGPLTALPFHLLATDKPAQAVPAIKDIASYRDAAWLLKRHAITVLPSVASLKALRVFAKKEQGAKPLVGFGDPVFKDEPAPSGTQRIALKKTAAKTRAYSDYWRGSGADRSQLADALPRLEDTADELKAVAAKLGAPSSDIYLGKSASETTVKTRDAVELSGGLLRHAWARGRRHQGSRRAGAGADAS